MPFLAWTRGSNCAHVRSGEIGLFVNSYLVEGVDGVVAVDAPLLLSDGRAFRARLEALGKPLLGVLVTHPAPRSLGHGTPTVPAVFADQRRYLLMVREAIGRAAGGRAELNEEEANRVASLMERYLPAAPLGWLVGTGASAVAAELAHRTNGNEEDE